MNIDQNQGLNQTQQFHRQYGANALLPSIDWAQIFKYSKLNDAQYQALETLYQSAVPLALQVFDELHFDVFEPYAYKPQGLGLFEKIAEQEDKLIQSLEAETEDLPAKTRHQIWSMLLRGGAVLVFKAWLGKVKNEEDCLFVDLGVYDATFLSLRDDRVAEYLKSKGYVTEEQIDELQCALNPLFCDDFTRKQDYIA